MSAPAFPLSDKIALVTGASRGIGRAAALALGAAGAQVVAVARTAGALEELDDELRAIGGKPATLATIDLERGEELDALGAEIHRRFGRLDILVHAGAMLGALTPVGHVDLKQWDKVVATNLTATFRLIRSTEPLLRAAPAGRAIFVTSGRAVRPKAFWGPYGATKAGMDHLVRTWADELENTSVRAAILDPGGMRTKMRAEAFPGEDPMTLPQPSEIGPLIVELAQADLGLPKEAILFADWKAAGRLVSG